MIRIGLIGCGWVSHFYGKLTQEMGNSFSIAWAMDTNQERASDFCEQFGGEPVRDYEEAPVPDAFIVATPHHLHAPVYLDIARHGKPVLMEKPLALAVAECDQLIAERDRTGAEIMVGYVNRYRSAPRIVKEALERGDIGKPLFSDLTQFGDQRNYIGGWILKRATLGGGCFFSSAGHLLDLASWFHGPIARMHLQTGHFILPMEGEDTALAVVRHANGALSTIRESWCAQGTPHWQQFMLYGSEGTLEMTYTPRGPVPEWKSCLWDAKVTLRTGDTATAKVLYEKAAPFEFRGQMEHFLECVQTGRRPVSNAESGRAIIAAVRTAEEELASIS